jgi:hypothetical protein
MMEIRIDRQWDGTPLPADQQARARLRLDGDALVVEVLAPFADDPAPAGPPASTWQLWEHEVVEVFVAGPDDTYIELELSPHGHWLALRLEGTRNIVEKNVPVQARALKMGARWTGRLRVPRAALPDRPWRVLATAIRGQVPGRQWHSSATLPGPQPDYHQLDRFVPVDLD